MARLEQENAQLRRVVGSHAVGGQAGRPVGGRGPSPAWSGALICQKRAAGFGMGVVPAGGSAVGEGETLGRARSAARSGTDT
jgi:hypothetical protein